MRIALIAPLVFACYGQEPASCSEVDRLRAAYFTCLKSRTLAACAPMREQQRVADAACDGEVRAALRANTERLAAAATELKPTVKRLERFNNCRWSKRWWQLWKRCKY